MPNIVYRFLHSPFAVQLLCIAFLLFFVTSFSPNTISYDEGEQFGLIDDYFNAESNLLIQEPGFITHLPGIMMFQPKKILEEDDDGNLIKVPLPKRKTKPLTHVIRSGENVHKIAKQYDLRPSTILWANSLHTKAIIRVGETLRIPPTDGVYYRIESGNTLDNIAKAHSIKRKTILEYNDINPNKIFPNQEIFLPQANKIFSGKIPKVIAKKNSFRGFKKPKIPQSSGFKLQRPTRGVITQGYKKGHFALDIANRRNTPIYASASGKVIKSTNGWNYGYGNYIIVDHGNGIQTLYSHLSLRKVKYGTEVQSGQLIGLMGNSGRVFGPTGIHLHFELRINKRKVNPQSYF